MYAMGMPTIVVSVVMEFGSKRAHCTYLCYTKTQLYMSKCSPARMYKKKTKYVAKHCMPEWCIDQMIRVMFTQVHSVVELLCKQRP